MAGKTAVFVDRDGVVNELVEPWPLGAAEGPLDPAQVRLVPGAAIHLQRLRRAGHLVVCVTNQPAAAKGTVDLATLHAVHDRVTHLLARGGFRFDAERICFHHPDGVRTGLARQCECRKPAPGMLLSAAAELGIDLSRSWMVGDTDTDVLAGEAAGAMTILVRTPASAHKRSGTILPRAAVRTLGEAVSLITSLPLATIG